MHVWTKCPTDCSSETQQIKNVSGLHCCLVSTSPSMHCVYLEKKKKSLLSINLRENVMMEACYGPCCTCVTDESHAPLSDQN